MVRGFISGVFWGLVFTAMSLWIVTQLSDVVRLLVAPNQITENAPDGAGVTPQVAQETANAPNLLSDPSPQLELESTSLAAATNDPAPSPDLTTPATPSVSAPQDQGVEAPKDPDQSAAATGTDVAPRATETTAQPEAPASDVSPAVQTTPAQPVETEEPVVEPAGEPIETPAPEEPAPADEPAPAPATQTAQSAPEPALAAIDENTVDFSAPQVVELTDETQEILEQAEEPVVEEVTEVDETPAEVSETGPKSNVTVNRLPTIGGETTSTDEVLANDAQPEGEVEFDENTPALVRFARPFENPDDLPLMAIVLLTSDTGQVAADQAELPIAVSYALDASLDGADVLMQKVRASGQEVVAIAPLIDRAQPADVEVAFADYLARVPEAVAVMDVADGRFQADRKVAAQVIANLASQGLGMITYKRGFNAGLQMAERDGLPAAMVFRDFDGAGQDRAAIGRFLDQAAFRAGQQSGVVMIGRDTPETIAALVEWSLGTRATTVKLAPISAVLQK